MRWRAQLKALVYGSAPGIRGQFPYFGTKVHFPRGSLAFRAACEQGIYESEVLRLIEAFARPGTWYFDVGGHLGLMSIPVLASVPDLKVLAFEPSPNVLPYLRRTVRGSRFADRWRVIEKAAGRECGKTRFAVSTPKFGLLEGIRNTGRAPLAGEIEVPLTTLDTEWAAIGRPPVSVIKLDVEGGELDVLEGAKECIRTCRPVVLSEWNGTNIQAYGLARESILAMAKVLNYGLYGVPALNPVTTPIELRATMARTESFLFLPCVGTR